MFKPPRRALGIAAALTVGLSCLGPYASAQLLDLSNPLVILNAVNGSTVEGPLAAILSGDGPLVSGDPNACSADASSGGVGDVRVVNNGGFGGFLAQDEDPAGAAAMSNKETNEAENNSCQVLAHNPVTVIGDDLKIFSGNDGDVLSGNQILSGTTVNGPLADMRCAGVPLAVFGTAKTGQSVGCGNTFDDDGLSIINFMNGFGGF